MKSKVQKLDWSKFKNLVHFICQKAEDPSCLGSVKLNKVLWYSDAINFMLTGKSITGETYVKRQLGPVPRHILAAIDELVREQKVVRGKVDHFGFMKNEYIAITEADISGFSPEEVALIDDAFRHVCHNHTARSISDETHGVIWQLAKMGEEIPLQTVFASSVGEIDEKDIAWAIKKAAALKERGALA